MKRFHAPGIVIGILFISSLQAAGVNVVSGGCDQAIIQPLYTATAAPIRSQPRPSPFDPSVSLPIGHKFTLHSSEHPEFGLSRDITIAGAPTLGRDGLYALPVNYLDLNKQNAQNKAYLDPRENGLGNADIKILLDGQKYIVGSQPVRSASTTNSAGDSFVKRPGTPATQIVKTEILPGNIRKEITSDGDIFTSNPSKQNNLYRDQLRAKKIQPDKTSPRDLAPFRALEPTMDSEQPGAIPITNVRTREMAQAQEASAPPAIDAGANISEVRGTIPSPPTTVARDVMSSPAYIEQMNQLEAYLKQKNQQPGSWVQGQMDLPSKPASPQPRFAGKMSNRKAPIQLKFGDRGDPNVLMQVDNKQPVKARIIKVDKQPNSNPSLPSTYLTTVAPENQLDRPIKVYWIP